MVHQPGDSHRTDHWLPKDNKVQREWLSSHISNLDSLPSHKHPPLTPALAAFQSLIESTPRIYMYFTAMWDEIPHKPAYASDPTGAKQIRSYKHMLSVMNRVFGRAPEWTDAAANVGMVGVPLCAVFDYAMGTPSGHAAFLDPEVNKALKRVLNEWGEFLKSGESVGVLGRHKTGWFGETGMGELMQVANAPRGTGLKFEEMYVCEKGEEYYGYKSWDDFFTRRVRPEARPVAAPDDDGVVANACESKPFHVARDVKLRDRFWIKAQPYSVLDMLAHAPEAEQFAGGTIYQAFLSALSYHRWHAPVSGVVRRAFVKDGTYFSEVLWESNGSGKIDVEIEKAGITTAQGYLTALATRAIIFFEADNPAIGLMAFIGIGMDEVSTCEITVKEGQRVKKGDEIGMFHFGGSSHCLMFRKGVKVDEFPEVGGSTNVPVRGQVCVVRS